MLLKKMFKLSKFLIFILSFISTSLILLIINGFSFNRARFQLIQNTTRHTQFALKIFGIKLKHNIPISKLSENYLIVSNHLSYLDIFVISSIFPTAFVTSNEMRETPFLGQLCQFGGCLFVERRSKKGLAKEIKTLEKALLKNYNVGIFPEAKSGDGEKLLKFRSPLFQSAINAQKNVIVLCLNYLLIDQHPVTLKNKDLLFWYGDMSFFPHFLKLIEINQIEINLSFLNILEVNNESLKTNLSDQSFSMINDTFVTIIS